MEEQRLQEYLISFSEQSKGGHLTEVRLTLMALEAMGGRAREPEVKLIIMKVSLSRAGISCSGR